MQTAPQSFVQWIENDEAFRALWRSETHTKAPQRIEIADDTLNADTAFRMLSEGTALLWRGDFQNAKMLLQAVARRIDKRPRKKYTQVLDAFNHHRMAQAQRSRTLGLLLIHVEQNHVINLRRAPDVVDPLAQVYGGDAPACVMPLRELQGLIGAYEWRKKGIDIPGLGGRIYPHYGVFAPTRNEYLALVHQLEIKREVEVAFDIGTGTGVIAAMLARRGVPKVIATDTDPRAIACATDNLGRYGFLKRVTLQEVSMFPAGKADLIICNPPWLPGKPTSPLEHAIYDPNSQMLRAFIMGVKEHLSAQGEAWLIMSDLAEHLGLRTRQALLDLFDEGGLRILEQRSIKATHQKAQDPNDPLHLARAAEKTSIWRLAVR